ncbi:MAG: tripartite tricarboxylate transporter substrate binding protein [Rhodoplanes sp.]|uniref:tripartite tricarboxylate transporter substrate binding protein n=1 Tax=Rhodoplanes sp. TaxID=1968906 RepID=UPI00179CE677|nr:tripartite tricarboxylate transporter substrate binding protein [Rhodoplanes sp.]NVO13075.1 tripartite tricarboxylate transporter substrate binding protein [Rhodoplanes sp.]
MSRAGSRPRLAWASAVLTACVVATAVAVAQPAPVAWPKQITLVVPFPPGASNDTFARALAQKLGPRLGATIVVDNKPGAGGSIGAGMVANAPPNGATLMLTSSTFATNAAVQRKLPYDPVKSFTPVALVAKGPLVIAVGAATPYRTLSDLLDAARADKSKLSYGSAGFGSINHMGIEIMNSLAQVEMTHVPYKGISLAITDVIGGHIQFTLATLPSVASQVTAGHVRALAVSSKERSSLVPDLAPVSDTLPGYDVEIWWGVLAPPGMPGAMAEALNAEIRTVVDEPDMRARFAQEGAEPVITMTAAQVAEHVRLDIEKWRTIARQRNILAD